MYIPLDEKFTWIPREVSIESERIGGRLEAGNIVIIGLRDNKSRLFSKRLLFLSSLHLTY